MIRRNGQSRGATLYDKLWDAHVVAQEPGHPAIIYIDLHLLHDGTYRRAFELLQERQLAVVHPELTVATTDHCLPTSTLLRSSAALPAVVTGLVESCEQAGIRVFGPQHRHQGIVHVIGPELGLAQPGMTVICADSHTTTHGALGALAFAVGTTQVFHALATQCVLQRRVRTLNIVIEGQLQPGVTAKDVILFLLAREGISVGQGYAIEYSGSAVRRMTIEQRMTLCNMTAELGARIALVSPDEVTLNYLAGREFTPKDAAWDDARRRWLALASDPDAAFDAQIALDASEVAPMVTYGTTPAMGIPVNGRVPIAPNGDGASDGSFEHALRYMGLAPGAELSGHRVDIVFIGSCTNSRVEDLRAAAAILRGRKVADGVRLLVVPGSQAVKRQAEAEGLDAVFKSAGAEWGTPSCSLCVAMNGEFAGAGQYVASTSNRNFQGRQGPGARTFLMSPLTAAATAVRGSIADPRQFIFEH
jgi:3-isopropylmalate/(R)-2-methylmalate dehydratase large subunit